jgi:hypothetical protein
MEALIINHNFKANISLKEVMSTFFREYDPETTKLMFWKFFQCWVTKDCSIKGELSDKEVALFFDQLMDLVAAAYILHQANRVSKDQQEGSDRV